MVHIVCSDMSSGSAFHQPLSHPSQSPLLCALSIDDPAPIPVAGAVLTISGPVPSGGSIFALYVL